MTARLRSARWASLFTLASAIAAICASKATAQAVDLLGLGINANFETPDVDVADSNTGEITSTNNIGAGWNYTLMGGAAANYGVGDPIGDTTLIGANHYCCYSATPTGGTLPAPFDGRQIGFFNLPDTDSIAQIASIPVGSLLAGQTYSLTIALGARATAAWADVHYAIGLATPSGTELGTFATLTMNPDVANQTNIMDVTYSLNVNTQAAAFVGQDASIVIRATNGFSGGPSPPDFVQANFDNVRLSGTFGAVNPVNAPALTIDRATGVITLSKTGATNYNIFGYQLSSTAGTFNPAAWTKVSVAYDLSGNHSVDADNNWTVLSAAGDRTDLSEAELEGGNGGTLSTGGPINLGAAWTKTPFQDVQATLLLAGGTQLTVPVTYTGAAIPSGDFNGDAAITGADWTLFKSNQGTSLAGLTAAQRYLVGDLNNDSKHDLLDFSQFRAQYDAFNGVGAFAALVASVPEPAAVLLMIGAAVGMGGAVRRTQRRRRSLRGIGARVLALLVLAAICSPASAQTTVAHWSFDTSTLTTGPNGILTASDSTGLHSATTQFGGTGVQINSVAGQHGQAAEFTNANANGQAQANFAWMSFPQLTEIAGASAGDFSVAAWVKVPDQASWDSNTILADWGNAPASTHRFTYWFSLANVDTNAALRPRAQIRAANAPPDPATIDVIATTLSAAQAGTAGGPTAFDDGAWHHLAWTYTKAPGEMRFYTDGALRFTQVTAQVNHDLLASDSLVGALGAKRDNNRYFTGAMDEAWVFNGALTDAQVLNLKDFNDANGQTLSLVVDQNNGQIQILNPAANPNPLSLSSYEISSASNGLDLAGWTRIASQNKPGFPVGDGSGNGWEASASASNGKLTEWYLQGQSSLAPGASVGLGAAYNESLDAADLVFKYTTESGSVVTAPVTFGTITPPANPADFDKNGVVNAADLTIWKNNFNQAATNMTGDANGDGRADGSDFLIWQRNLGTTSGVAAQSAVPEPTTVTLFVIAGVALAGGRRRRRSAEQVSFPARRRAALSAMLMACVASAGAAHAAVTLDRTYSLGDDPAEFAANSVGAVVGAGSGNVTYDSTGVTATGTFQDLEQAGGPVYANVGPTGLARPGATANQRGITFDGLDDYVRGLRLGFPGTTASSTTGGGTQNYKGLSNRGFQLWVNPNSAGTGTLQNVVVDSNQHGARVNVANNWVLRYNNADVASTKAVTFNAWSHVMVVRPFGTAAPNGGSILYVNGEAVAAAPGNYNTNDDVSLVVGANTGATFGTAEYFNGTLDDLTMFVLGKTVDGVDRGTFNFRTDNGWAATHLTANAADVNQDGSLTAADVTAFLAGWNNVKLVNGVRAGDMTTILKGDLNFDGITNLTDAGLLNAALAAASLPALDVSALPAPEPSAFVIAVPIACLAFKARRRLSVS